MTIRVMQVGLGPIGAAVARQLAVRKGFRIVAAVDIDPHKVGRDVGEIAEIGKTLRVKVTDNARKAAKASKQRPDAPSMTAMWRGYRGGMTGKADIGAAVGVLGICSKRGASQWWNTNATRYASAQIVNRMLYPPIALPCFSKRSSRRIFPRAFVTRPLIRPTQVTGRSMVPAGPNFFFDSTVADCDIAHKSARGVAR